MGLREFHFLKQMEDHPNIIKVFNYHSNGVLKNRSIMLDKDFDYMSMEYCPHGDLFELIKRVGRLEESVAKALFVQVLNGVEYMHGSAEIAHLDLKLENILIGKDCKLKICDFGFAEDVKANIHQNKGTDGYKAPEIYIQNNDDGYDGAKADIFSLGVILFILIFGVPPFTMATKENAYYRIFYRGANSLQYFFRMHPAT